LRGTAAYELPACAETDGGAAAPHPWPPRGRDGPAGCRGCLGTVPAGHQQHGTTTAIVGPSGSGKTTLIRLATRFFDPQAGEVRIGRTSLGRLGADNLRRAISPVFRDSYLFSGTLGDNVRLARPGATSEELSRAAAGAGLTDVIAALPDGWDSQAGEGGARLSGGERQRVVIARACSRTPPPCCSTWHRVA